MTAPIHKSCPIARPRASERASVAGAREPQSSSVAGAFSCAFSHAGRLAVLLVVIGVAGREWIGCIRRVHNRKAKQIFRLFSVKTDTVKYSNLITSEPTSRTNLGRNRKRAQVAKEINVSQNRNQNRFVAFFLNEEGGTRHIYPFTSQNIGGYISPVATRRQAHRHIGCVCAIRKHKRTHSHSRTSDTASPWHRSECMRACTHARRT